MVLRHHRKSQTVSSGPWELLSSIPDKPGACSVSVCLPMWTRRHLSWKVRDPAVAAACSQDTAAPRGQELLSSFQPQYDLHRKGRLYFQTCEGVWLCARGDKGSCRHCRGAGSAGCHGLRPAQQPEPSKPRLANALTATRPRGFNRRLYRQAPFSLWRLWGSSAQVDGLFAELSILKLVTMLNMPRRLLWRRR